MILFPTFIDGVRGSSYCYRVNTLKDADRNFCKYCLLVKPTSEFRWIETKNKWTHLCNVCKTNAYAGKLGPQVACWGDWRRPLKVLETALAGSESYAIQLEREVRQSSGEDFPYKCMDYLVLLERIRRIRLAIAEGECE